MSLARFISPFPMWPVFECIVGRVISSSKSWRAGTVDVIKLSEYRVCISEYEEPVPLFVDVLGI